MEVEREMRREFRRNVHLTILILLLASLLAGCATPIAAQRPEDLAARKLRIVATTGMVADAVRNVGGERADVTALMGPGVDPHLYKASEGDVLRLGTADVVFYSGLHLEAKLGEVLERMGDAPEHVVTDGMDRSRLASRRIRRV